MMKARHFEDCFTLEQIPNVGPAVAADLRALGVQRPKDLRRHDPYSLYKRLCRQNGGMRQDPCMLDTLMAAVDFMAGGPPRPWWHFTEQRRQLYGAV